MKLQQLKYLLAIVDNGLNITAAADRLYTSQPGVSKQLKLLEEELGMQLFTRKGKSLDGITAAGYLVIERARSIMNEVETIRSLSRRFREEHRAAVMSHHAPVHATLATAPELNHRSAGQYRAGNQ
jgi:DNA-binding transcriptional LysR family regulator